MPNTDVSLDVRNFPSNGSDGYKNTTTSTKAVYSYQYGGGNDGHGNSIETADGQSGTITVALQSDSRYQISDVVISGDIEDQLSFEKVPNSTTSVVLTDKDTSCGNGYYEVIVFDSVGNCTFPCDPQITNVPTISE